MQDLLDAGLPLPAVNQIAWAPGALRHGKGNAFKPEAQHNETFASLFAWCKAHGVQVNGYSPFGGSGGAKAMLGDPAIKRIAAAHGVGTAQVVLRWNLQHGVEVNPLTDNPAYMKENLDLFGFELSATDMRALDTWQPHTPT